MIFEKDSSHAIPFFLTASSDHVTGVTGASPTVTLSKNGGAFSAASGSASSLGSGWYALSAASSNFDTVGAVAVHVTASTSSIDNTDFIYTVADTASVIWTKDITGYTTADTTGNRLKKLGDADGTAAAGTSTTITLANSAVATDDYYNGRIIAIQAGTGVGQARIITDYTSGRVATVSPAWVTTPDNTSEYFLSAGGPIDAELIKNAIIEAEGSVTIQQALSIMLAVLAGQATISGGSVTYKDPSGTSDRAVVVTTTDSERTSVSLTPSS